MQKSTVAGILSIVAGALGLIGAIFMLLFAVISPTIFNDPGFWSGSGINGTDFANWMAAFYGIFGFFGLALSVLGIVGGIFAIQRKYWGWALAGAIASCLTFLPLGVAAVVLVAMGKNEFGAPAVSASSQPLTSI
jgi:hypothetical protein